MALKSAWELALERTGGKTTGKLTAEQLAKILPSRRMSRRDTPDV